MSSTSLQYQRLRSLLTAGQAADAQGLGRVEREPVLAVLNICHGGHWVEISLEWKFLEVPARLDLMSRENMEH